MIPNLFSTVTHKSKFMWYGDGEKQQQSMHKSTKLQEPKTHFHKLNDPPLDQDPQVGKHWSSFT